MSNLIKILKSDGQLVVTSREIGSNFEKDHAKVTRDIESLIEGIAKNGDTYNHLFIESQYQNDQNKQWYKEYLLTRDGFSLLVMGFTGQKALQWKMKYIEAFNNMERVLKNPKDGNMKVISLLHAEVGELIAATSQIESRVENLENNMTIDYAQQLVLQEIAKSVAIEAMGGKDTASYKDSSLRSTVFAAVWKDYKEYFQVNSYKNTARIDFDKAKEYLKNWKAQGKILRGIEDSNNQVQFSKEVI